MPDPDPAAPPEPEDEGFRDEQIAAEQERKAAQAVAFDERSAEAKLRYLGVAEAGDVPGSAIANQPPVP